MLRRLGRLGTRRLSSMVGASPFSDSLLTVCREPARNSARCGALGMKCGMTQAGQFESHGLPLKRYLRDFRVTEDALLPIGTSITVRHFVVGQHVDVQGITKGKGFQGVMKRWGFAGQPATHGVSLYHRGGGSLGGSSGGKGRTRVWKGKKMAGRMGNKRRTMLNLRVYKVDTEHNLLYLKGTVAGATGSIILLRDARGLQKSKRIAAPLPFPPFLLGDPIAGEEAQAGEASAAA